MVREPTRSDERLKDKGSRKLSVEHDGKLWWKKEARNMMVVEASGRPAKEKFAVSKGNIRRKEIVTSLPKFSRKLPR